MFGEFMFGEAMFGAEPILQTIAPTGIPSTAAVGSPQLNLIIITPSGISSTAAVGSPNVVQIVQPSGIASTAAVGSPSLIQHIVPTGIASAAAVGSPLVVVPQEINLDGEDTWLFGGAMFGDEYRWREGYGISTNENVGTPSLHYVQRVFPAGIPSAAGVGSPRLREEVHPDPVGILVEVPVLTSGIIEYPSYGATLTSDTLEGEMASEFIIGAMSAEPMMLGILVETNEEMGATLQEAVQPVSVLVEVPRLEGTMIPRLTSLSILVEDVSEDLVATVEGVSEELLAAVA